MHAQLACGAEPGEQDHQHHRDVRGRQLQRGERRDGRAQVMLPARDHQVERVERRTRTPTSRPARSARRPVGAEHHDSTGSSSLDLAARLRPRRGSAGRPDEQCKLWTWRSRCGRSRRSRPRRLTTPTARRRHPAAMAVHRLMGTLYIASDGRCRPARELCGRRRSMRAPRDGTQSPDRITFCSRAAALASWRVRCKGSDAAGHQPLYETLGIQARRERRRDPQGLPQARAPSITDVQPG
jgi:hypothetical protein